MTRAVAAKTVSKNSIGVFHERNGHISEIFSIVYKMIIVV